MDLANVNELLYRQQILRGTVSSVGRVHLYQTLDRKVAESNLTSGAVLC